MTDRRGPGDPLALGRVGSFAGPPTFLKGLPGSHPIRPNKPIFTWSTLWVTIAQTFVDASSGGPELARHPPAYLVSFSGGARIADSAMGKL